MSELTGNDSSQKEFQISLSMSGAISAGAYTAGVFDFLIEALEAWEAARARADVPNHRVGLKAMSGASAGAITAAVGAIALADADTKEPGKYGSHTDPKSGFTYRYILPRLYRAWVEKPTFDAGSEDVTDFLSFSDLDGKWSGDNDFSRTVDLPPADPNRPPVVTSLLNARLLDEIAKDAITVTAVADKPRAYVSKTLHIYLTLSNLRGVPYRVPFEGGDYHMISHGDRVHYAVAGLGGWASNSAFGDGDKPRPLVAKDLIGGKTQKNKWKDFSICALASSAYPVGLAPRLIGATLGTDDGKNEYFGRRFPIAEIVKDTTITPDWSKPVLTSAPFWFTCADGGIIDNDPFEFAHFALKEQGKLADPIECALDKVDRAVIMITPFPEEKPILPEGQPGMDIVSLFTALMPSLIDQARFKPDELALAANKDHASRYLIGPSRDVNGKTQRYGIASGLLGGFGGFVARAFRDHDYQLGRRNCQQFLRESFVVSEDNDIVKSWPATVLREDHQVTRTKGDDEKHRPLCYRLIPLIGDLATPIGIPKWPQISHSEFERLQKRIAGRFDRVAPLLVQQNVKGFLGFLLGLVLKPLIRNIPGLARDKALTFARWTIYADLVRRDQIEDWSLPGDIGLEDDDARLILAELADPKYDLRTVNGILKAVGPSASREIQPGEVVTMLEKLTTQEGKRFQVWEAPPDWTAKYGINLYGLVIRKPSSIGGYMAVNWGVDFFKPTFDPK